jgi:hypothetical protein
MAKMYKQARQRGAVLLVGLIILMVAMAAGLTALFSQRMGDARKEAITAAALAQAKAALLGWAWRQGDGTTSNTPVARPGELPCPDLRPLSDPYIGTASASCPPAALGRLPWKTLGLPDLRDGSGERLWYARSVRFRNQARLTPPAGPLNPDTAFGQITVRLSDRMGFLHRAASPAENGTGAVAVIIAPGAPIRRNNNLQQNRTAANYLTEAHYLDCWGTAGCNVEDNANFVNDDANNGFIMGPIRIKDRDVVNDRIVTISRDEILSGMVKRVAGDVAQAVESYFLGASSGRIPAPAAITNDGCLGAGDVSATCLADLGLPGSVPFGRIPSAPSKSPVWNADSVFLKGASTYWFQQNAWREFVFYAVAPACAGEVLGCVGSLAVNNPPAAAVGGKRAVIIVSGAALPAAGQQRLTNAHKRNENNYLEDQNSSAQDSVFARRPASPATSFNDAVATVPRLP